MHNSDFTLLNSATIYVYGLGYFIYSIWSCDRFECLRFKKLFSGELKTVLTVIMFLTMSTQFVWDVTMTYIKYKEGYILVNGETIVAPFDTWSTRHQRIAMTTSYVQSIAVSLQVCIYYMLQCFWHYLTNTVAKKDFMGSFEFKFYIVWSLASMILYPVLEWYFHEDLEAAEAIPDLIYGIQILLSACLGVRTHYRFKRLIKNAINTNANTMVVNKLSYFSNINFLMIPCLFSFSFTYLIGVLDGLVGKNQIAQNRFATDCLLANGNLMALFLYILFISVFHPRRQYSPHVTGSSQGNNTNNQSLYQSQKKEISLTPIESNNPSNTTTNPSAYNRFSQRVTSFIGQKINYNSASNKHIIDQAPTESFQQTFHNPQHHDYRIDSSIQSSSSFTLKNNNYNLPKSSEEYSRNNNNGGSKPFLRPMSPVSVDYPPSTMTDTIPLTENSMDQYNHHHHVPFYTTSPLPSTPSPYPPSSIDHQQHYSDHPLSPNDIQHSEWLRSSPDRRNH